MGDLTIYGNVFKSIESAIHFTDVMGIQLRFTGATTDLTIWITKELAEELHIPYEKRD